MILMTMLEIIGLTYKVGRHKVHAVYQSSGRPHRCVCVCESEDARQRRRWAIPKVHSVKCVACLACPRACQPAVMPNKESSQSDGRNDVGLVVRRHFYHSKNRH